MNFLKKYYSQLIFLIIGILAGFFISRLPIEFDTKTNWIQLANFFLTIVLALYLEFVVRPSISNNRNEKDLLIDQLKEIKEKVNNNHEYYLSIRESNPLDQNTKNEILSKLRGISNLINLLKQTDEYCVTTKRSVVSQKVFKAYLEYKKALTGNKFNDDGFSYDRYYFNKHNTIYKSVMQAIIHGTIDVNKA
jgi:hypothetical protein